MVRWCWVNFHCRGVLQFGYSRARAYCARSRCGWGLFGHFTLIYPFSPSLGDGSIWTEILSQRAVKPKTTNQPTIMEVICIIWHTLKCEIKNVPLSNFVHQLSLIYHYFTSSERMRKLQVLYLLPESLLEMCSKSR